MKHITGLFSIMLCLILGACRTQPPLAGETVPISEPEAFPYALFSSKDYEAEPITLQHEGRTIIGISYVPRGEGPFPCVILSHGIGTNLTSTMPEAMRLAEAGYLAVVFDFCGGSSDSESSGDMKSMSLLTEEDDLILVLSTMEQDARVQSISLLGQSQGGYVSALCARDHADEITSLVLWFPAFNINDLIRERYGEPPVVEKEGTLFDQTLGPVYFEDAASIDPDTLMKETDLPVLILHGTEDDVVPPSYSEQAASVFPDAQYIPIEGAGHGFFLETLEEAHSLTLSFLNTEHSSSD